MNPTEFVAFPKNVVIGIVPATAPLERVQQALGATGIPEERVAFLSGDEGVTILTDGGPSASRLQRLIRSIERVSEEGLHLATAVDQIRTGNTVVAVHQVRGDEAPEVRQTLESAGVGKHHYFGSLTFD